MTKSSLRPIENVVDVPVIFTASVLGPSPVPLKYKSLLVGDSIKYPSNGSNVLKRSPLTCVTEPLFTLTISLFFCTNVLLGSCVIEASFGTIVRPNDFFTPASKVNVWYVPGAKGGGCEGGGGEGGGEGGGGDGGGEGGGEGGRDGGGDGGGGEGGGDGGGEGGGDGGGGGGEGDGGGGEGGGGEGGGDGGGGEGGGGEGGGDGGGDGGGGEGGGEGGGDGGGGDGGGVKGGGEGGGDGGRWNVWMATCG
jgi:hypothetical protein